MKRDECPVPCEDCLDYDACTTRQTISGARLVAGALTLVALCLVAAGIVLLLRR